MDLLFILLVFGAVVASAIGYVIWLVFFVWAAKKGIDAIQADMNHAQQLLQQYQFSPPPSQAQMRPEILQLLTQANAGLQQMDSLRRQQYDVKAAELQSMAAQAGIDWTPPTY